MPLHVSRPLVYAALLLALPALAAAKPRSLGELQFNPCSLAAEGMPTTVEAQCTTLEVAENRADPASRRISLALAWVPASGEAEADPVFMLAGGPGQSARESYPMVHPAFRDLRRSRHVLLLDARGTGGSNPLVCRDHEGRANMTEGLDDSPQTARAFAERCAAELAERADLRFYGTGEHIDDIDAVRQAIGADKINLIGISYGTRVAQQYAGRYPQHTRTVTLDSIAPNTLVLGGEHARNLESALNQQFERCRQDAACGRQLGDPRQHLDALRERLRDPQPEQRYRAARSGEWQSAAPTAVHLLGLVRMYAYSPQTVSLLPLLLQDAASGDFAPLLALSQQLMESMSEQIYHGMQLSVMCNEDADELRADPADADTLFGQALVEFTRAQCEVWPRGQRDPKFRQPLTGELPVLLLSGEYDPVTPPRYGDEVLATLPNGRHLVLKGQGHSVLGIGCAPKLLAQFVERADAKGLDASCLDRLQPLPPFAGRYGWEP